MSSVKILDEITPAQRKALAGGAVPDIIKKSDNPGATWDFAGLQRALNDVYQTVKLGLAGDSGVKNAVLVFGDQGSGKSEVVRMFAQNVAKAFAPRKYLHFNDLKNVDQMSALIKDPSGYFVFLDLRAAQLAEHQVGGLPNPAASQQRGFVVWDPADWTALVTSPNFAGYMFLDEMNRAPEGTLNSLLGVVLDRQISGKKLSDNCFVAAAANLGSKFVGVTQIDPALFARFNIGTLIPDAESWARWAQKSGVEQAIIDFVMLDSKKNFIRNPGAEKQSVNPRNLFYASQNLKYMHYVYDNAIAAAAKDGLTEPTQEQLKPYLDKYTVVGSDMPAMTGNVYADYARAIVQRCGEEWTNDFMQYLRNVDEFEFEDVIKKLETGHWKGKAGAKGAKEVDVSKLYYLIRYISDILTSKFLDAYKAKDEKALKQIGQWFGTALNGVGSDQRSFIMDRVFPALLKGAEEIKGSELSQVERSDVLGKLYVPALQSLTAKGDPDSLDTVQRFKEWAAINLKSKSALGETNSAKAMFQEMVAYNPKISYKPKFKNFFKTS